MKWFPSKRALMLLLSILIGLKELKAQDCRIDTGTYYSIDVGLTYGQPNAWTRLIHIITKDISAFKPNKKNKKKFIKSIFNNSQYFLAHEMLLIENLRRCDSTISKNEVRSAIISFKTQRQANYRSVFKLFLRLNDSTGVGLYIEKFNGTGWLLKADNEKLNSISGQVPLSIKDYKNEDYFVLKSIVSPMSLSDNEKKLLVNKFKSNGIR